jgi:hypothetical protein
MPKKRDEKQPIILSLHQVGTPDHQRFCISDQYLRYWAGEKGWTDQKDESKAMLFASAQDDRLVRLTLLWRWRHLDLQGIAQPTHDLVS